MESIINPLTNEKTLLKSPEGKGILLEYVKSFQEGGDRQKNRHRPTKRQTYRQTYRQDSNLKNEHENSHISLYSKIIEQRNKLNQQIETQRATNRICPSGMIVTYNIQGTYIKSGLFDGTLKYIQDTPSIFCVQEIGGLTKNQTNFIKLISKILFVISIHSLDVR